MRKNILNFLLIIVLIGAVAWTANALINRYRSPSGQNQIISSNQQLPGSVSGANSKNNDKTSFSFAVLGDTKAFQPNHPKGNLEKAVVSLQKQNFDFTFVMGDLVSSCDGDNNCVKKYNDWKNTLGPDLLAKTYEVMGNHDRTGGEKADAVWQKAFNLPTNGPSKYLKTVYSFDYGNSHFVVLNSENPEHLIADDQQAWLEKDLAATKKANIFVLYHEPAYQTSQNAKDGLDANPAERDKLINILKKYHVKAVFNGHEHIFTFKKLDGLDQIVVGDTDSTDDDFPGPGLSDYSYKGKAFAIVSIDGQKANLNLYTVEGNLLKSIEL